MEISELSFNEDTAEQTLRTPVEAIRLQATNIRRERTGIHARVCLYEGIPPDDHISYDTFNLDRSEDRGRLFNRAWKKTNELVRAAFPQLELERCFDLFCAQISTQWELERFKIESYDGLEPLEELSYCLRPYILDGGGTILFSPPGSGKSYLVQIMAICLVTGADTDVWDRLERRPVLYVNLERSGSSIQRREHLITHGLGVAPKTGLAYLHARGFSMESIIRKVKQWSADHARGVVIWDSISRTGLGSLVDDTTANRYVDYANAGSSTWLGIGHTPRATDDHLYGSVHFDAGEDIGISLKSETRGADLGLCLTVTKANEGKHGPETAAYYRLHFETDSVELTRAKATDFPELHGPGQRPLAEQLKDYAETEGRINASAAAKELRGDRGYIVKLLHGPDWEPDGPPDAQRRQWYHLRLSGEGV